MKNKENLIRIGDIIVIAVLLSLSAILFLSSLPRRSSEAAQAVVCIDGKEYGRYSLQTEKTITIEQNGHTNIIEIKNGAVRMLSADCSDNTCVNQGWITRGGEIIVCLPARLTITLDSAAAELDSVVY